jgi:hypothetical protein
VIDGSRVDGDLGPTGIPPAGVKVDGPEDLVAEDELLTQDEVSYPAL